MSRLVSILLVSGVVVSGCGPAAKKPVAPERDAPERSMSVSQGQALDASGGLPASPAGFAAADLATVSGGVLATWQIVDGKLARTSEVTLVKGAIADEPPAVSRVGEGEWADRDHLFVRIGEREVVMVTGTAITRIAVPPASAFRTPKPKQDADSIELEVGDRVGDLVVQRGAAYWSQCAWGFPADGFQCSIWVHARLWPTPDLQVTTADISTVRHAWPTAAPPGFSLKTADRSVTCTSPGTKSTIKADADDSEQLEDAHWISIDPPRLLVTYGHLGMADLLRDRWTMHAGCSLAPIAKGEYATPGPNQLWLTFDGVGEHTRVVLYRGGAPLGELPADASVKLRPAR